MCVWNIPLPEKIEVGNLKLKVILKIESSKTSMEYTCHFSSVCLATCVHKSKHCVESE